MEKMKYIAVLGSTGSIGKNTLSVVRDMPNMFKILAISTNSNTELLTKQIKEFKPKYAVISRYDKYKQMDKTKFPQTNILYGDEGLSEITSLKEIDVVVNAIIGFSGFKPTINALKQNKIVALANKETMVAGSNIVKKVAKDINKQIIPIDSELSAIQKLISKTTMENLERLIITASGGALRKLSIKELKKVTPEQALKHPNWSMGKKITIDSATMMNKGLEVIEAHNLFGIDLNKIETVIHKESIIHSMIETLDGEMYAQMSVTDMKLPIQNALTYPDIYSNNYGRINFNQALGLTFQPMDFDKYPLLKLAYSSAREGHTYPTVLNSVNEACVEEFLSGRMEFGDFYKHISNALENHKVIKDPTLEDIINIHNQTLNETKQKINEDVKR